MNKYEETHLATDPNLQSVAPMYFSQELWTGQDVFFLPRDEKTCKGVPTDSLLSHRNGQRDYTQDSPNHHSKNCLRAASIH